MAETEKKKDRFLCCGYKGINRVNRFWTYTGQGLLLKSWMIVSPLALAALIWLQMTGYVAPESAIARILASVLYLVLILGSVVDVGYAALEARDYWDWHEFKMPKLIVGYAGKAATLLFLTASPIYMVWALTALDAGELAGISSDTGLLLICGLVIGAIGSVYDGILLFGSIVTGAWDNRNSNFIGMTKRTGIRGFGVAVYYSGMCK